MLGILLSYYFKNEHTLKKSTRATTSENLLQGWSSNRRRERFVSLPSRFPCDTISLHTNFYYCWCIWTLFPFSLSFFSYNLHIFIILGWVLWCLRMHVHSNITWAKRGTNNEVVELYRFICMVQVDFCMCALSIALFYMLLNKNKTIAI